MPFEIEKLEIPDAFVQAWNAAGRHLQSISQDGLWWLRDHLHQPIAEHFSFRVGNQLFFVFVEVPNLMEFLLMVADEAKGLPCLMRMRQMAGRFVPDLPGWGLTHARTGERIVPPEFVTSQLIEMTDWEVHDFAVWVARAHLEDQEKKVMSWQPSARINPSIYFLDGDELCWTIVRSVRFPSEHAALPPNILEWVALFNKRERTTGYFASIVILAGDQTDDGPLLPLYRGHALASRFEGLEPL
jgi:hypothetical protein